MWLISDVISDDSAIYNIQSDQLYMWSPVLWTEFTFGSLNLSTNLRSSESERRPTGHPYISPLGFCCLSRSSSAHSFIISNLQSTKIGSTNFGTLNIARFVKLEMVQLFFKKMKNRCSVNLTNKKNCHILMGKLRITFIRYIHKKSK